ncbi:MAG: efflux RND transporter periplasmic adaptor subunit [Desulfovibrio sp.]|nr:efflux RND transporter periplasmic adaptor subunit [Desulfovibrio sp.]
MYLPTHFTFRRSPLALALALTLFCLPICAWPKTKPSVPPVTKPAVRAAFQDCCVEPGFLRSDERIVLRTRISGFVDKVLVREGDAVRKGQRLVSMDGRAVDAAIAQRRALLENARIEMRDAERDIAHYGPLAREGAYPREQIYKLQVRLRNARAACAHAQAALDASLADKDYSGIESPLDGVVVARHKNNGDMASPGEPILTLDSSRSLMFRFYLPEGRIGGIAPGTPVELSLAALPGRILQGRVRSVVPAVDEASHRFEVNADVEGGGDLVPGMYGRATVVLGVREVLAVPEEALARRGGLLGVFVAGDGRPSFRWLRIGRIENGLAEVQAGLDEGEQVVLTGLDSMARRWEGDHE